MKLSIQWLSIQRIIVAGLSLALPLSAQEPPVKIPVLGETIDVRVVNVEAVVTDSSKKLVRGLSAGDFRLLVDGQEVPIEYFTEVEEGTSVAKGQAAATVERPSSISVGDEVERRYLIYVDDSFSLANRRDELLTKLESDLTLLRPADQMAVLAFDGSHIDVLCGWTFEAGKLREAFGKARQRPAQGGQMLSHQRALQADVDWVDTSVDSIETGDSTTRVGGPKVYEMYEIHNALSMRISPEARTQLGKTAAAAAAALRSFEAPPGRKVLLLLSGAWSLSVAPDLYGPLVEAANRLGYTVYPVDASQSDAPEVTLLDKLARATGGRAIVTASNHAFREVVADSGSYYWIGFTPTWKADDQYHQVAVEVRRSGLTVRSRSGFSDPSLRAETARKAEGVLLFGGAQEEKRLIVQLGEPRPNGWYLEVPVTLGVPVEALAPRPEGGGYLAEIPLAVAAEDKQDGRRAYLPDMHLQVVLPTLPPAGTFARFQTVLRLGNAEQRLVFTIQDQASGQTLWGQADLVPMAP